MPKVIQRVESQVKTLTAIDLDLFDTMVRFSHLIPNVACKLFYDRKVARETYVDRCLQWLRSDAGNKNIVMSGFTGDDIHSIIARVCYENNTRCTPIQEDATDVRLIFG
jgi:hypothetical protein